MSSNGASNGQQQPSAEGTPLEDRLLSRDSEGCQAPHGAAGQQNGVKKASQRLSCWTSVPSTDDSSQRGSHQITASAGPGGASNNAVARPAAAAAPRHERIELLSSSTSTSARNSPAAGAGDVIDLTLDSDDESEPSVPTLPRLATAHQGLRLAAIIIAIIITQMQAEPPAPAAEREASATTLRPPRRRQTVRVHSQQPWRAWRRLQRTSRFVDRPNGPERRRSRLRAILVSSTANDLAIQHRRLPGGHRCRHRVPRHGANGSRPNGNGDNSEEHESARGAHRDGSRRRHGQDDDDDDDSWMDNANATDQDQLMNEDDWWP